MSTYFDAAALLKRASIWYAANGPKLMLNMDRRWADFWQTEKFDGSFEEGSDRLANMSNLRPHLIPLLAAIQAGFDTEFLAQVIEHHCISNEQIDQFGYKNHDSTPVFKGKSGQKLHLLDITIATLKAREHLNRLPVIDGTDPYLLMAAMHLESKDTWPVTIIENKAALKKNNEYAGYTRYGGFFTDRHISRKDQLPDGCPHEFLLRSGMLSKVTYLKEIKLHGLWEELCMKATYGADDGIPRFVLNSCKDMTGEEKTIIRYALTSMHPASLSKSYQDNSFDIYKTLHETLRESDLADVLDSTVLKINLYMRRDARASTFRTVPAQEAPYLNGVVTDIDTLVSRVSQEILARPVDQLGFAHLEVFSTLVKMSAGPQIMYGFEPEALILHLDAGIASMLGNRAETNQQIEEMCAGISSAYHLLSPNHEWDMARLVQCSSLGQKILTQVGVPIRNFPNMSKKHRGDVLEDLMGL
jgi:hypothetical protein